MKKIILTLFILLNCSLINSYAATIEFVDYPTIVYPGEKAVVTIQWKELPQDSNYFIKVQLENWDIKQGFFIDKDITAFPPNGTTEIVLEIPKEMQRYAGCRFVAAVLSKSKMWAEILAMAETKKEITVGAFLEIKSYPKSIMRGDLVEINLEWNKIPKSSDYKLVVQLENWDVSPSILITTELEDFQSEGEAAVLLTVPKELSQAANCRFTAAFISKIKGRDDTFCIFRTPKDVTLN